MKKLLLAILALLLLITVSISTIPVANASTGSHSQADAVSWINGRVNERWCQDVDSSYGCQCVDLVKAYYKYLIGYWVNGWAYQFETNSLPSGWQRLYSTTPKSGDVIVWSRAAMGNDTGHVALCISADSSTTNVAECNGKKGSACYSTPYRTSGITCVIRPDFASPTGSFDVNVILDGQANNSGISGLTFDVYINGSKAANDVTDFYNSSYSYGTTYKVDDIKTIGSLIYTGNSSYSGIINSAVEVKLTVKTGLTIKSDSSGKYRITIPANYQFDLYASATATSRNLYALSNDYSYSFICDHKYVLSDGSVRYRYSDNGEYRYFKFTSAMKVEEIKPLTIVSSSPEGSVFKVTIPANYRLYLFTSATAADTEYYIPEDSTSYTLTCSYKVVLSDGSTRYGYKKSDGSYRYFTYISSKMSVDEGCSKGHTYTTDSTKLAKAATCTSPALYYKKCSKCGAYSTETFSKGKALGHNFVGTNELADPATCTTAPRYFKKCSRCGVYDDPFHLESRGNPLGHNYSKASTVSPTCTEDGYSIYKCSRCSSSYKANITNATGHSDNNRDGKCDACGLNISSQIINDNSTDAGLDVDNADNSADSCDCPCHDNGTLGKIWKVLMTICRLLGISEYKRCDCGTTHF